MPDPFEQIQQAAAQVEAELAAVKDQAALEHWRIKWLGSNGLVKGLMGLIGQAPKEQKKVVGQQLNEFKSENSERVQ